jgi:hypothetical protein
MKRIFAIAKLTLKAAFRYRLVMVLAVLLLGSVVALPLMLQSNTAHGLTQIILTYTLSVVTFLLGFTTLWLSCSSLAREIEECQIQMLVAKPIARWQIWLGKWLGILFMNALLLAGAGGAIYGLIQWRARQLPEPQRQVLDNEVLVARGSMRENVPDIEPLVEQELQRRLREQPVAGADVESIRNQVREQVKAQFQLIQPNYVRRWVIDLGRMKHRLQNVPLFVRVKFLATEGRSTIETPRSYVTYWQIGVPESARMYRTQKTLVAETANEFPIPPGLLDDQGRLTIECLNPDVNNTGLLFLIEDGLEVLYREGGFGLNFIRGLIVIFCWLALLAALGLATASFLSFPVAVFVSLAALIVAFSSGTMSQIIAERGISGVNPNSGTIERPALIDQVAVVVFSGLLKVVNLVREFSPIDSLSTGRSITWFVLARAVGQIILLMGGLVAGLGISLFYQRELATTQGS